MTAENKYDFHVLEDDTDICENCINYKDFKDKCWYFWERKKECSQKLKQ